jgi:LuxR family maltose regulon positive regulatory protein
LFDRLDAGKRGKLTLVSAPAGFGKTTLVSEWAGRGTGPVSWLSLDEGDNDKVRFLSYIIAALQSIESTVGQTALDVLQSPQPPQIEPILLGLINEIVDLSDGASRSNPPLTSAPQSAGNGFALVIDDYHVLETQQIHDAVSFLIDQLPPLVHLVITTREDPPLPLARWRAGGQMSQRLAVFRGRSSRFSKPGHGIGAYCG